ncbi:LuxR C-terminal-related transcriptional regulator, partial [Streptomyces sp900105755]|uniref:helix-turn-helix transcriptional regulator n=1 Tax=Streptomyces sp. 900105755 TaxID=3154389 RepID=UPI00332DAAED
EPVSSRTRGLRRSDAPSRPAEIAPLRIRALLEDGRVGEAVRAAEAFAAGTRDLDAPVATAARRLTEALLARADGDLTGAAGLFEEAGAAWTALPRPYDALLAREAAADCHLAVGERDRAVALLREAFDDLTALGATEDADRVRRTLADEGVRTGARSGRPGYGDQLSPRELDVVRLLVEGRTSAQIARVLGLSPRTVEKHVHSAMRKRQAPSRTALAVAAVESGDVPLPGSMPQPSA